MKNQNAFTLIEMLLYLALTAIFLGGILVCIYGLLGWTQDDATRMQLLDDANFQAAQILWSYNGMKGFDSPKIISFQLQSRSSSGRLLSVNIHFNIFSQR